MVSVDIKHGEGNGSVLEKDEEYPDIELCLTLAGAPTTDANQLHALSAHKSHLVRRAVAKNPNTEPKTLDRLSTDEELTVRIPVIRHPNTKLLTLIDMMSDLNNANLLSSVIDRIENTSGKELAKLNSVSLSLRYVGLAIINNPNVFPETLNKMFKTIEESEYRWEDATIYAGVAEHPNTPLELVSYLAVKYEPVLYWPLLKNSNLPFSHFLSLYVNTMKRAEEYEDMHSILMQRTFSSDELRDLYAALTEDYETTLPDVGTTQLKQLIASLVFQH